ncbi:MAG: 2-amino-4-hydroxy-6-hydroxymethyldihydropteridine diphosphokinase [Candidatus Cloacimonetes bacterium]|jgi:dihydroneopterin aldolase/2-amino-4-hydroxy-6-hydroxymethyldihydropteridine diphosphokinase|nr:2-amino-4-hydroxy-6-hydroxymethyldihydropteridine diphosphokinase [Candidatus Cloacimonadota bacterium]
MIAYLCLGSNLDNPETQIHSAWQMLAKDPKIRILKSSPLIQTKPVGNLNQPDFFNQVIEIETFYSSDELLQKALTLENQMGRVRQEHWGPRTIDIDILIYEDEVKHTKDLILPHPEMANRKFVLELIGSINPNLMHPVLHKSIADLLKDLNKKEVE